MQLSDLLAQHKIEPVLIDIGASADTPAIWNDIASCSTYIGFDPDLRDVRDITEGKFHRSLIINEAVTEKIEAGEVSFYLTKSPYCSSVLEPDMDALEDYAFYDLFTVERTVQVKATTLDQVLERFSLPCIDWIKIDSQGTDLRLFESVNDKTRSQILAVDVEPGLIDSYHQDDRFVETHQRLTLAGFWLSNMQVEGVTRIRKTTLEMLASEGKAQSEAVSRGVRISPGWVEARYLRDLKSLKNPSRRDCALLWVFAMLDTQYGFALDVALEYRQLFGRDDSSDLLMSEPLLRIDEGEKRLRRKSSLPARVLRRLQRWVEA